ncbi:M28 family peptidase [Streptosporangium canum]|uniref:M28 family peptidase n=1 Tax=Streptosporangium canum TaxID=324952 RepID=UPI0036B9CD47
MRELYATPVLEWSAGGQALRLEHRRDFVGHLATADLPHPHTAPLAAAPGVAAVLETARILTAGPATRAELSVAFLDAEETGAWGSAHHAPALPSDTLVINLDGAAQLHQAASVEAGGPAHALPATLDQAARLVDVPLRAGAMASDNRRYAAAGLAAIGIGMGMPATKPPPKPPTASSRTRSWRRRGCWSPP